MGEEELLRIGQEPSWVESGVKKTCDEESNDPGIWFEGGRECGPNASLRV